MLMKDGKPFNVLIWLCIEIEYRGVRALLLRKATNLDDSKFEEMKENSTDLDHLFHDEMLNAVVTYDRPRVSEMLVDEVVPRCFRFWSSWYLGLTSVTPTRKGQAHYDLMQLLKKDEKQPEVKAIAMLLLEEIDNDRAIDGLMQSVKDEKNLELKMTIVWVLGIIGDVRVVKDLVELAKDEIDLRLRMTVVQALGRIQDDRVVDALMQLLKNGANYSIKTIVVWALGQIGDDRPVNDLNRLLMDEDNLTLKMVTAWTLGEIKDTRSVDILIELLRNEDNPDVKKMAIHALGRTKDIWLVDVLIELLKDENDPNVKMEAISVLSVNQGTRTVDILIELLRNEDDPDVKMMAINALGKTKDTRSVDVLIQMFKHGVDIMNYVDTKDIPIAFFLGLKDVKEHSSLYDLKSLLNRIDSRVLVDNPGISESQIEELGRNKDLNTIDRLVDHLTSKIASVRRTANNSLAKIGTLEILEKIIKHPRIYIFEPNNLILAKVLAFHNRKRKTDLIPVYPEVIRKYRLSCEKN